MVCLSMLVSKVVAKTGGPSHPASNAVTVYSSAQHEGLIGITEESPIDNPVDNIFHIAINKPLSGTETVWLTYELEGVEDHTSISRSINDQLSVGGYLIKKRRGWATQREQISAAWLKQGDNIIRFTTPENPEYSYKIKGLKVEIESSNQHNDNIQVIINQPSGNYYFGKAYIKGLITGAGNDKIKINVAGKAARVYNGEFESVIDFESAQSSCSMEVEAVYPDGSTTCHSVTFEKPLTPDFVFGLNNITYRTEKLFRANESGTINLQGASLSKDAHALKTSSVLSITTLRDVDIPALDGGMVNVTRYHSGFRFLPHGTVFSNEVSVSIPFDMEKIPDGYTEKDIRTYYFDEQSHHWITVPTDTVLLQSSEVVSKTTHFTDYINAIIKVPESPEAEAYNSTSMKGIKAANPTTAVNLINPPQANNTGNASMGYQINIPGGRNGMQPELAINYNSGGGNGWMGLGWNLSVPSIGIETRWGVPRYKAAQETETYSMNGEQLSPVAHRGSLQNRVPGDKQFYPRVEGAFNRIIRHGNNPTDYWWEVTDKSGTRYFYGGNPTSGPDKSTTLRDNESNDKGNIAHWALSEVRDLNNNFVKYHYAKVEDTGLSGGTVKGYQLYIDKITYTGHSGAEGKYTVLFTRDRELNEAKRVDISIMANLGFKQVTADLLRKIEVQFEGKNIRSYELKYKPGAFFKTLLSSVSEYDASGKLFNTHDFDYYNEVGTAGSFKPLTAPENWSPQDDDVKGSLVITKDQYTDKASALSGTKSSDIGAGVTVTVGPSTSSSVSKALSVGGSVGFSQSKSEGLLSMIDINGDGLPDKVFMNRKGDKMYYRPNQSGSTGNTVFGAKREVTLNGTNNFYKEKSKTLNFGLEASFYAFVGFGTSKTTSVTSVYFSEVNGDQLPDLMVNGKVYFNHIDAATGDPVFTSSSSDTPSPIIGTGSVDGNIIDADPQELETAIDESPLHDIVRMWNAPSAGKIKITGTVRLLESKDTERAEAPADGVLVKIQHNDKDLWTTRILATDYTAHSPNGVASVTVRKGDRLFFRTQSVFNGSYDSIQWSPTIEYLNQNLKLTDANNKPRYSFSSEKDFVLAAKQTVGPPFNGRVVIDGNFTKPVTSDNIHAEILQVNDKNDTTVVWNSDYAWDVSKTESILKEINVDTTQLLTFRVSASTNIDWSAIQWHPRLYYVASYDSRYVIKTTEGKPEPFIDFHPVPEYTMYNDVKAATTPWIAKDSANLTITPHLEFSNFFATGQIIFSIKKANKLLYKDTLTIVNGVVDTVKSFPLKVKEFDSLYLEYHISDAQYLASLLTTSTVGISVDGNEEVIVSAGVFTTYYKEDDLIFGSLYRGWGHFAYNGNRDRADAPIDRNLLHLSKALKDSPAPDAVSNPDDLKSKKAYDPSKEMFIVLGPMGKQMFWQGYDANTYLNATTMSSSRLGEDDLTIDVPVPGGGARGIKKISKSISTSFTGGVAVVGVSGSYSTTNGTTDLMADFMDMNGDRYPDIVTDKRIQYTTATGGLEDGYTSVPNGDESVHQTTTSSDGFSAGGYVSSTVKGGRKPKTSVGSAKVSGSINVSVNKGTNETSFSWMDINGDGLPDRVHKNGMVALNLGYSFAPDEAWLNTGISKGNSTSESAGLSVSIGKGGESPSYSAGIGLALSKNFMTGVLEDVNGDGLVDEVQNGDGVKVKLNKGNGFASDYIDWAGASQLDMNSSSSQSANVSFTGCIPISFIRICFNPNVSIGNGVSRDLKKLTDIDGDGFPDYITSDADDENLKVSRSTIGRTNMLKGVKRPLGATFAMSYKRIGNTYEMPNNVWVLDSVKVFDGFKGDGVDNMLTTYAYEGGYYDRHEREFYGFEKVITNSHDTGKGSKPVYTTVAQNFINDNYYEKGLVASELMTDGSGNKFVEKENVYQLKDIATGAVLTADVKKKDAGNAFPALIVTQQRFYEGQSAPGTSTSMTYDYDAKGNVTNYTDFGDEGDEDNISSTITYHNLTDKYIVATPKHIIISGSGKTYRKRESVIDVNTGDVKQIKQFLSDTEVSIHDMEYDEYGNLKKITRPKNAKDQRLSFDYVYDNVVHSYTTRINNSYGYSSESTYDFTFGQALSSKDLNGNQITYELDDLGRVVKVIGPYEKSSGNGYTIKFEYHPEAQVPWALTNHYDPLNPKNDLLTSIFVDGLGRVLQTKKDVSIYGGDGKADTEMMAVSGRVTFDAFGRTVSALYPIIEASGTPGTFNTNVDDVKPTTTTYDVLNRALTVTLPDNAVTQTAYSFESDKNNRKQFSTKTTDANGKQTEQFTDVRGRVTSVKNYTTDKLVWTSFKYNAINEQIEAIDDLGNITLSTYDNFGRRILRKHPDAGTTQYTYDLAGNLKQLTTANLAKAGGAITYTYDFERLTDITYPENPENNVKYTYGEAGATDNRAGRIVLQQDATGAQEFFYGPLGEVIKNVRTVVIPKFDEQTYVTEWQYDTWNRLTSMIYADGETVTYSYNTGGLLRSMTGKKKSATFNYVNQLGYDKFEQRVYLAYGNGTKTNYSYEPDRRRLKNMTAQTANKRLFMDNAYIYDKVNNILGLKNNAPIPASNLMGGSSEYSYAYDDLYRLTKAEGSFKGSNDAHTYTLNMDYNSVGGIIHKGQNHQRKGNVQKKTTYDLTYTYSTEQPHAPIHIGDQTYTYDTNGNQTGWTDDKTGQRRKILWDEENRIRSIYDNGSQQHYVYDAAGERVLKGKSTGQTVYVNGQVKASSGGMGNYTVYVNPYLVLRSGGYTKHYYIEDQRIVSKLGAGWDNDGKGPLKAGGDKVDYVGKNQHIFDGIVKNIKFLGANGQILTAGKSGKIPPGQIASSGSTAEKFQYYYHPDHLGSTSYVTDANGEVYQHLEYFAFGETFVEEHSNTDRTPYLYNGKELDEETGLYYYGARYYDAKTSIWQSVDPFSDKYPALSPYQYTTNNPISYIDPNGKEIIGVTYDKKTGKYSYTADAIKNGVDKYIEARTQTKSGRKAVGGLIDDKKKYTVIVTDKLLVTESAEGKYGLSSGEADIKTSTLVISTNTTKADAIDGTVKAVTLKDGKLVDVDINQSNLVKQLDGSNEDYTRAYEDSGLKDFENKNQYRTDKERINGTAAHEEVHLTPYGNSGDVYHDEGRAFTAEKKARVEYIETVY